MDDPNTEQRTVPVVDELLRAAQEAARAVDPDFDVIKPDALLPVICATELFGKPVPQREFLVEDMIPRRTASLLSGDGGVGKSLAALQLAFAVVTSTEWFGKEVISGRCLFITAEDDLDETHRRINDICVAESISLEALTDLDICSLAGLDAVMAQSDNRSNVVTPTKLFASLKRRVAETRPELVILDTLADLFSGDENNRMQARQFIGILRSLCADFGATVLLLSHPSLTGMSSGSGMSGSTAWNNSVRSRLYMRRPPPAEGRDEAVDPNFRFLETMKANYGKTGGTIELRWKEGRFISEERPALPPPADIDEIVITLFKQALKFGRSTVRNKIAGTLADEQGAKVISGNRKERIKLIGQSVDFLIGKGMFVLVDKGPPSRIITHVAFSA